MEQPKIVEMEQVRLLGVRRSIGGKRRARPKLAEAMLAELGQNGTLQLLKTLSQAGAVALVNTRFSPEGYERLVCALEPPAALPGEGLEEFTLPAGTWAVFTAPNRAAAKRLWEDIYSDWFPECGFGHGGICEAEVVFEDRVEIWIHLKILPPRPAAGGAKRPGLVRGQFWPQALGGVLGLGLGAWIGHGTERAYLFLLGGAVLGALIGWLVSRNWRKK